MWQSINTFYRFYCMFVEKHTKMVHKTCLNDSPYEWFKHFLRQFVINQGVEDAILHTNRWLKACGSVMLGLRPRRGRTIVQQYVHISAATFEGNAVNLALLATTARLCAQRSAEGHSNKGRIPQAVGQRL